MTLSAYIHSVETCGTVDGPGIRYVAFFQGCPLVCKYCHNPDTWTPCGGQIISLDDLFSDILKYQSYMKFSGGGFTASGGEPMLQPEFLLALLKRLKKQGIRTAIDTAGSLMPELTGEILSYTDLVLLDIKSINPDVFYDITSASIETTLKFSGLLKERNIPVWVRNVIVPGLSDKLADIEALADYLKTLPNLKKVELLPFHKMGEYKWEEMKLNYALKNTKTPDKKLMAEAQEIMLKKGLPC